MIRQLILATFFLCAPARAEKSDFEKQPVCSGVAPVVYYQEVVFYPVYIPKRKVYNGFLNIFFAKKLLEPCEKPQRVRSTKDARCYLRSRLP